MFAVHADVINCVSTTSSAIKPISSLMLLARVLVLAPSMPVTRNTDDDDECFNAFNLICGCSCQRRPNYTRYVYWLAIALIFSNKGKSKQYFLFEMNVHFIF